MSVSQDSDAQTGLCERMWYRTLSCAKFASSAPTIRTKRTNGVRSDRILSPVVNGGAPMIGRDAIIAFFQANPLFNANFVGLTPSFRTKISVHRKTAEVYLSVFS